MSFGTVPNALVVIAVVVVVLARRLSWSELENSDTDVWRGPVVLEMSGLGIMVAYLVVRLGLAGPSDSPYATCSAPRSPAAAR